MSNTLYPIKFQPILKDKIWGGQKLHHILNKQSDLSNSLTRWKQDAECPVNLFGRQAIPMIWDFAEAFILSNSSGSWQSMYERTVYAIEQYYYDQPNYGQTEQANAAHHPLPNDFVIV